MTFEAKVIEDSIAPNGKRLTTLQLRYPRFIHAEFMTHRMFSRNASSSRAIPVAKMVEQVRTNPAMPVHWGKNQPGMQASEELDDANMDTPWGTTDRQQAKNLWGQSAREAADRAESLMRVGVHKQIVNRILEPFQWISVIVTATEWDNFFELRDHPDAQPEIQHLARFMRAAMRASKPRARMLGSEFVESWHLPYITDEERHHYGSDPRFLAKLSVARCARVSYLTHEGKKPLIDEDLSLFERLVGSSPLHASPTEHQGYPLDIACLSSRNFRGWLQHRELIETSLLQKQLA